MEYNESVFSEALLLASEPEIQTGAEKQTMATVATTSYLDVPTINQTTITKQKNSIFNIFNHHHHHTHHTHHNQDQIMLTRINSATTNFIDYSSDALLNYCRDNNILAVKEILTFEENNLRNDNNELNQADTANNLQALKRVKIDLEIQDEVCQTPLIIATRNNFTEIANLLIEHNANVNASDLDSWTPLLNSSREGNLELVEKLLQKGASIELRDCGGFTPLMWSCYKNHVDLVKCFIKNGANVNAQCKNSISCLSWAAGRGSYEVVVQLLKVNYIKVNSQDRNSSTPLLWAARKGSLSICQALVERGANPDLIGMNSMTPLLIACKFGYLDVALYLVSKTELSLNHLDKDGLSALSLATKIGYTDIVLKLLEKGAYVNIPNKKGDSVLITAVKAGHKTIIDSLLSRHVEIDHIGNQGKTALYHAIEKGSLDLVRTLLKHKPDVEIIAQDGDTLLLLAVKRKYTSIVNDLLNYGSKVSSTDKNGDNVLHISLRNRSREITELILANPKNSKYLYKPNKKGETPHKIDASNPKSILLNIFGAQRLNMTQDSILGYDLYSSAIAEILSEPSLHTPITVGLYAKWGSGKSFLLSQLRAEMKSFAKLTHVYNLKIDVFLVLATILFNLFFLSPFLFWKWEYGLVLLASMISISFFFIWLLKFFSDKREKEWAVHACRKLYIYKARLKILLKILFLNPNTYNKKETFEHKSLKFIFTDYGKISTIGGENSLALMVATLYSKIEEELGIPVTRLCRVFYNKNHSHGKFKRFCCIPTFVIVVVLLLLALAIAIFFRVKFKSSITELNDAEKAFVITFGFIILISIIGSSFTWVKILWSLVRSPKNYIMNIANSNKNSETKVESFIFKLKREVDLISHTVKTIDSFSNSCTRLCIIIDGLDSCEQSKVVQILEIIHVLFTRENDPFISILAVDPHVLIRGIEGNLTAVFRNGSVNGHDYLRTIIHLPVFLQVDMSALEQFKSKSVGQVYQKRLSNATMISSSTDGLTKFDSDLKRKSGKKQGKKSSQKTMSACDLTDQLLKSDYFLDINPRNLRRLVNIIALTGRLLRAYHIDFNWSLLASWIYLNEQWPYRCSWIIMHYEDYENQFNEDTPLYQIYNCIKHQIPTSNEPLLELDRNQRKFEHLLQNGKPTLNVAILKKLLPCTCNLDPYLIKLIKYSIENSQDKQTLGANNSNSNLINFNNSSHQLFQVSNLNPTFSSSYIQKSLSEESTNLLMRRKESSFSNFNSSKNENFFKIDMLTKPLNEMTIDDLYEAIDQNAIESLSDDYKQIYKLALKESNINGKVLSFCNLDELKLELKMSFGDWQLFKNWIQIKRLEQQQIMQRASQSTLPHPTPRIPIPKIEIKKEPESLNEKSPIINVSSSNSSSRKVEFFITPVIEMSEEKNDIKSMKSTESSNTLESEPGETSKLNANENKAKNNSVTKIGKKIFQSIDNLFSKNSSTSLNSLNQTSKNQKLKNSDQETEEENDDDNNESDDSEVLEKKDLLKESETNTTILSLNNEPHEDNIKLQQPKSESKKSNSIKNKLIGYKKQFSKDNETDKPHVNVDHTSSSNNTSKQVTNKKENKDNKDKTCYIFEEEDEDFFL